MDAYSEKSSRPRLTAEEQKSLYRIAAKIRELKTYVIEGNKEGADRLVNGFSTPCIVLDHDRAVRNWNKPCEELTGIATGDAIGTRISWLLCNGIGQRALADLILVEDLLKEILAPYPPQAFNVAPTCIRKSSHPDLDWVSEVFLPGGMYEPLKPNESRKRNEGQWIRTIAARIVNKTGNVVAAVQTIEDITLQKSTHEKKRRLRRLSQIVTHSRLNRFDRPWEKQKSAYEDELKIWGEISSLSRRLAHGETFYKVDQEIKGSPANPGEKTRASDNRFPGLPSEESVPVRNKVSYHSSGFSAFSDESQLSPVSRFAERVGLDSEEDEYAELILEQAMKTTGSSGGTLVRFDTSNGRNLIAAGGGELCDAFSPLRIESLLLVPVLLDGDPIGRIVLFDGVGDYNERNIAVIEHLAHLYALALNRRRSRQNQDELNEQLHLAQRMDAIGRLAGGVAHDFNNLLTIISAGCSLVKDKIHAGDPLFEDIHEIENATKRAAALTSQLLTISRRKDIVPESLDINRLIRSTAEMIRKILGGDIRFTTTLSADPQYCLADRGQVEQVMLNLALNARDAMKRGGKLCIETSNLEANGKCEYHRLGLKPGKYIMVTVRDNGCGMDADTRKNIFEPFFTTKAEGRGTGLGLSMVYGIINRHKGHIWVESETGKGTAFKFCLPQAETHSRKPSTTTELPNVFLPRGKETVLLVDDDEPLRQMMTKVLEKLGYTVLQAMDGIEAVMMASMYGKPIELLITDVVMPGAGGRQLADSLIKDFPEMRVLFMSGYSNEAVLERGINQGGIHFLKKPFTPRTLSYTVRKIMDDENNENEERRED